MISNTLIPRAMLTDPEPNDGRPSDALFLHEIEALSKALALDANIRRRPPDHPTTTTSSSSSPNKPSSSIWTWKPLRAFSHIRRRRLDCRFSLRACSIHGLPPTLADAVLCVHCHPSSSSSSSQTRPSKASAGSAVFDDTLTFRCPVHRARTGPHRSAVYDPAPFIIYAAVVDGPELNLGKHRVDLARLLPVTPEDGRISGEWNTSFPLSGPAKGGSLDVSFGFSLVVGGSGDSGNSGSRSRSRHGERASDVLDPNMGTVGRNSERDYLRKIGSNLGSCQLHRSLSCLQLRVRDDDEEPHENQLSSKSQVSSEHTELGNMPSDSKSDFETSTNQSESSTEDPARGNGEDECDVPDYVVIEKGIEIATLDNIREFASKNVVPDGIDQGGRLHLGEALAKQDRREELTCCDLYPGGRSLLPIDSMTQEVDSMFCSLSIHELEAMEYYHLEAETSKGSNSACVGPGYLTGSMNRSRSLDDITETVATEFLSMLGLEKSPSGSSSSSEMGLSFEKQPVTTGDFIFDPNPGVRKESSWGDSSEDFDLSLFDHASNTCEHEKAAQAMQSELIAQTLIEAETEAIMQEWGLDEDILQNSPPESREGFGSPIEIPGSRCSVG